MRLDHDGRGGYSTDATNTAAPATRPAAAFPAAGVAATRTHRNIRQRNPCSQATMTFRARGFSPIRDETADARAPSTMVWCPAAGRGNPAGSERRATRRCHLQPTEGSHERTSEDGHLAQELPHRSRRDGRTGRSCRVDGLRAAAGRRRQDGGGQRGCRRAGEGGASSAAGSHTWDVSSPIPFPKATSPAPPTWTWSSSARATRASPPPARPWKKASR